jgi:hypothetical protein
VRPAAEPRTFLCSHCVCNNEVANLIGVVAMRVRIALLAAFCLCLDATGTLAQSPDESMRTKYAVDGLALGARLSSERAAYREYRCSRSDQFEGFTWCQKVRNDRERRGSYRVLESMLLSQNGEVSYINRYQEPAFLESVSRLRQGLQSFRNMRRMDASFKNARALRLRFSQSLARRRQRLSHAIVRSTIQRLGNCTKPFA